MCASGARHTQSFLLQKSVHVTQTFFFQPQGWVLVFWAGSYVENRKVTLSESYFRGVHITQTFFQTKGQRVFETCDCSTRVFQVCPLWGWRCVHLGQVTLRASYRRKKSVHGTQKFFFQSQGWFLSFGQGAMLRTGKSHSASLTCLKRQITQTFFQTSGQIFFQTSDCSTNSLRPFHCS